MRVGDSILAPSASDGYIVATVTEIANGQLAAQTHAGTTVNMALASAVAADPQCLEGTADLTSLAVLHEANIVQALRVRHAKECVYSAVGAALLSVNPYQTALISSLYSYSQMGEYVAAGGSALEGLPPHLFKLTERAFRAMEDTGVPQAVVISGESGAGKTEAKRQCVSFLTARAAIGSGVDVALSSRALEKQLVQCNPMLEAFGNAATTRNKKYVACCV